MKSTLLFMLTLLLITACGGGSQDQAKSRTAASKINSAETIDQTNLTDANTVYIYYFHGKQRCKTCIAVEKIVKETIDSSFTEESKVKFNVVLTDEAVNKPLVDKYEISWNSLIIAKGENSVNLTEEAFANAVNKPQVLIDLIKKEVNSRL
ncbi:MAG: nitrophenyl compound nitroreductase subunit ArsF family protein [Bacteroidales bacterium]